MSQNVSINNSVGVIYCQRVVNEIFKWIKNHPQHSEELIVYENPVRLFFRFLADPDIVCEYENPINFTMNQHIINKYCDYVFKDGPLKNQRCNVLTQKNKSRCKFHDHIIFDIMSSFLNSNQDKDETLLKSVINDDEIDDDNSEDDGDCNNCNPISIDTTEIPGLYREVNNNLMLKQNQDKNAYFTCIGYLDPENNKIMPLTPDLEEICKTYDIIYTYSDIQLPKIPSIDLDNRIFPLSSIRSKSLSSISSSEPSSTLTYLDPPGTETKDLNYNLVEELSSLKINPSTDKISVIKSALQKPLDHDITNNKNSLSPSTLRKIDDCVDKIITLQ